MAASAPIPVDDQGRVAVDLPCLECGYNLRTQPMETGRCPECSLPVGRSVVGNQLRFCDPAWLTQLGHGLTGLGVAGVTVGGIAGATWALIGGSRSSYWRQHRIETLLASQNYLTAGVLIFAAMACIYAAWRSTAPDPMTRKDEWLVSTRKLARWCLLASVAWFFLLVAAWTRSVYATGQESDFWSELTAIGWRGWPITFGVGGAALMVYAASLARRARIRWLNRSIWLVVVIAAAAGFMDVLHQTRWFGLQPYLGDYIGGWFPVIPAWAQSSPSNPTPVPSATQWMQIHTYPGPFGLTCYDGEVGLWGWTYDSGSRLIDDLTAWARPIWLVAVLLAALLLLRMWSVIWTNSQLARSSWAGVSPTRVASRG
ncbi:MAG: hypothetical protein AAFY08_06845 [Planctomycetota bacterium]